LAVAADGATRPAVSDRAGAGETGAADVAGAAAGETDAAGDAEAAGEADGSAGAFTVGDGLGEGERSGFDTRAGRASGDSVADGDGSGNRAGADWAAGIVAATVGVGAISTSVPRFPTIESPAPITNPSTTTPIKIGSSGKEGPGGGGGRFRVLRGGEPCIAPVV
jgi:hypothetical protein